MVLVIAPTWKKPDKEPPQERMLAPAPTTDAATPPPVADAAAAPPQEAPKQAQAKEA
jgi:hypothetical protein